MLSTWDNKLMSLVVTIGNYKRDCTRGECRGWMIPKVTAQGTLFFRCDSCGAVEKAERTAGEEIVDSAAALYD